ncbi:MAG: SDR family oxidoreductase [Gemmataceae bacterium]|nr:SDR family oxidoreductase [Gemmataceae bacterium]
MDKLIVGCGYLGRRVAKLWLEQGHRVFGTTRSERRAEELRQLGLEPIVCEVLKPETLKGLPPADTVLYCVGFDRSAGRSMYEVYVDGLRNFIGVHWVEEGPPGQFIYVGSTSVYGQHQGEEVDEFAGISPDEEAGRVVVEVERLLRDEWLEGAIRILRFAGIYGPGRLIRRAAIEAGEPLIGDPDKWLNLIHVEDGAAAIVAAETSGSRLAIYNVSDGNPVRRRDFYTRMAQLLRSPEPRFVLPEPGEPLPPHERANRRIVNRRMREELGVQLRYPSYEEGLAASL